MVDSTRNTQKVSFQNRPAEIEMLRTLSLTKFRALDPFRTQMSLYKELNEILTVQNSDENALQALDRRKKEESERSIEKKNKAQGKRKREKETESHGKQADEVQGKRRREEVEEKPIEKRAKALRKRKREKETESPAKQAGEVQGKRRREEVEEKPIEKRAKALRKRKREKETESPAKQADEVQGKRRREEKPIEKRVMALRKRRREETESPAKQAYEVKGKRRREEEEEKPIEKRAKALRKRKREKETESPAKQAGEVQGKRRREEVEEKPIEKRAKALRKRKTEKETESSAKQADEVQGKRRREEEEEKRGNAQRKRREEGSERPIEKRAKALGKGRREVETECHTEQADEIQRKCKKEKPIERRAKALRKRRRDKETECPTEQADDVPRKKSRAGKPERPAEKRATRRKREEEVEKRAKAPKKRESPVENRGKALTKRKKEAEREKKHKASGKREKGTAHPAEKLDKTAQKKGNEEKIERRKQEIMELLIKADKEAERSRQEKKRMEEEARVPGCLYPESFIFHKVLGVGSHGKVMLATHCDSGKLVALKIVEKLGLTYKDRDFVMNEREVMKMVMGHPYCTQLYATFQSEDHLYYVMEFCSGGDLRKRIESKKLCDLPTMRRLAAELLCGLQFVHSKGILHSDVNPDNILLDCNGHVKLADFGIAEANMFGTETRNEEFGTELYMAPEIFNKQPFDKDVDYFALGVTLFEAAFGIYPFDENNPRGSISWQSPNYPVGAECVLVDFLNKLLCKSQKKRKAYIANIRKHRFFRGINWEQLEAGETRAPFSACEKDLEEEMTKTTIDMFRRLRYYEYSKKAQAVFMGFSFMSDEWKAIQKLKTKNTRPKKKLN